MMKTTTTNKKYVVNQVPLYLKKIAEEPREVTK